MNEAKTAVVVPNWNGVDSLGDCLDSLTGQTEPHLLIVVDNGSVDGSAVFIKRNYPHILLIENPKNLGFAGGVNYGIRRAMDLGAKYVALFNNDAVADKNWLKNLVDFLDEHEEAGIVTSKICDAAKKHLDSTGDLYTIWGLPYPRGRGETLSDEYDESIWVFGASGGASLYRIYALEQIGLFDEDFFAYYEDIDISFRAQLAGWKVGYESRALVYHQIGATSRKVKGFTTYQTMKNLPWLLIKNVPTRLFWSVSWRFKLAYWSFFFSAFSRGQGWPALKGLVIALVLAPKKLAGRRRIQRSRKVPTDYISSMMTYDLPPNARKLRALRHFWFKLWRHR